MWTIFPSRRSIWALLELIRRWTQNFIIISMEFLSMRQQGVRAVKKFFSSRLIMNSRRLWNSHQRRTFLRAEASRDIVKFRISEIASPGVFNRYFPPRTPCCFVGIHARLEAMPSKCPRRSTTSHGSNVSQIWSCLNMRSMSFKTGKRMLHNFIRWCLFFFSSHDSLMVEGDGSSRLRMVN